MNFKQTLKTLVLLIFTISFTSSVRAQLCSGLTTLTAVSGSISDGSGSGNYANNANCSWLIQPTGNPASITFTMDSLDLAGNIDAVRVYDGTSAAGTLIAIFRGTNLGNSVIANSGSMFVQFTSNAFGNAQGWRGSYTSASSNCQPNTIITAPTGAFTDGTRNGVTYANNTNCEWLILQTAPSVFIEVNFSRFDLASGDSLILYDGPNAASPVLATLVTNSTTGTYQSSGGSVFVRFSTNANSTANGWRIVYNTQPIPFCSGLTVLNSQNGLINDGSLQFSNYVENSNCQWLIQPPGAATVDLQFNYFSTEANFDFVRVYQGTNNNGVLLGSFSGNTLPPLLTSTTGTMFIEFTTDNFVNSTGWECNYTSSTLATINASIDTIYLNAGTGSTNSFQLTANANWRITDNQNWLFASPVNGTGNQTVNLLAIQANIGPERVAELYINATNGNGGDTVIVIQRSSGRFLDIPRDTLYFSAVNAPSQSFNLLANVSWSLSSSVPWVSTNSLNGNNNASPLVSVTNNKLNQIRTGYLVASGTQNAGNDTIYIVQDSLPQSFTVTPRQVQLAALSGSFDSVQVNSNVTWSSNNSAGWFSTNPTSGIDTALIKITASSDNFTFSKRSSYIYFSAGNGRFVDSVLVIQDSLPQSLSASPNSITLGFPAGSSDSIQLRTNVNWTGQSSSNWLTISPNSGSDSSTIVITANTISPTTQNRNATVIFTSVNGLFSDTVNVVQLGIPPVLTTSPDTLFFESDTGNLGTVNIISTGMWNTTQPNFFEISKLNGSGNDNITVKTSSFNQSGSPITESLVFNNTADSLSSTVVLVQKSLVSTLSVNPDSILFAPNSGEQAIVTISSNTFWAVNTTSPWLNLSKSNGRGNDSLTVSTTSQNTTGNVRTGIITINSPGGISQTITVIQLDATSNYALFSVDTLYVGNSAGSVADFSVIANGSWSLTETSSWLQLNKMSGTNTEVITARAGSNNLFGSIRFANVTASSSGQPNRTLVVAQLGAPLIFSYAPDSLIIGADSASFGKFNITSNLATWSASTADNWLRVSPINGSLTEEITVTAVRPNNTGIPRSSNIIISSAPFVPLTAKVIQDTIRSIGLNETSLSQQIALFPNPTTAEINLQFTTNTDLSNTAIEVFDVLGKQVDCNAQVITQKHLSINLSGMKDGFYFIKITSENQSITKKVMLLK